MRRMDNRNLIVLELCPDIVEGPECGLIADLQYVLANKAVIKKVGNEWHARVGKSRFVFKNEPTEEHLRMLLGKPRDLSRHIAAVNDLRKRILYASRCVRLTNQFRIPETQMTCGHCKGKDFAEYDTHYSCKRCGVTKTKYEQGLDYRNIKERSQSTGDMNTSNYHTLDPMISNAANRQTVIGVAPGERAGAKKGAKPISVRNLNAWNKRLWRDTKSKDHITEKDEQYIRAKRIIEDLCEDLFLGSAIPKRALGLFGRFLYSREKLPRENETIAACLFEALPPKPKIYPKKKKRETGPYNDTRQKRLRRMTF